MVEVAWDELTSLCTEAIVAAGGDEPTAAALADAVLSAERHGNSALGVSHLFDYLDALDGERLNGAPHPTIRHDHRSVLTVNADDGIAQLAFTLALPALVDTTREAGVAVLSINNAYPVGALSYYTARVAEEGLVALAMANTPALMSLFGAPEALTGTNPFSFALPGRPTPRIIDQASSVVAWVRIREAAAAERSIPLGWALSAQGEPTADAASALLGPVLPFGGIKGSNIAVVIELLSVLSGSLFSMDAPAFNSGDRPPRIGLFLLALDPVAFDLGYLDRVEDHLARLQEHSGVAFGHHAKPVTQLRLPDDLYDRLCATAAQHR